MATNSALVFTKCSGLNDSTESTGPLWLEDGTTDFRTVHNVTTTSEGKLVKIGALVPSITTTGIVAAIHCNGRMFVQKDTSLYERVGTSLNLITNSGIFSAGIKGKYIVTPTGLRVNVGTSTSYEVRNNSNEMVALTTGVYNGPVTSLAFSKMPEFESGFVFNSKLYIVNGKFLQFSQGYNYDLFNLADDFIGNIYTVLQAGAIPGCLITVHAEGITGYFGTGDHAFRKEFFPCSPINGTLYSGEISKLEEKAHVVMCKDGLHVLTADGKFVNLTADNTDDLTVLNSSYNCTYQDGGKYVAVGDLKCVEYDFKVKAMVTQDSSSVVGASKYGGDMYLCTSTLVARRGVTENTDLNDVTLYFPYSNWNDHRQKQVRFLYFTGKLTGTAIFAVRTESGQYASKTIQGLGYTRNYKIDGLRIPKDERLAIEIVAYDGFFKLEELRAVYIPTSSRS